jgi:ribosome-binding protein aMBF1 (putative translation factor)
MTPDELSKALEEMQWSYAELSRRLKLGKNTIYRWKREGAPAWVAEYLRVTKLNKEAIR